MRIGIEGRPPWVDGSQIPNDCGQLPLSLLLQFSNHKIVLFFPVGYSFEKTVDDRHLFIDLGEGTD